MASTTGRRVVEYLTNKSGGAVAAGDVVVVDTGNDEAFTTTTTAGVTGTIGIAQEAISNNAAGRILTAGYAGLVNVNASVTRGNFGKTHTVAKQAANAGSTRQSGAFCQFLTGGTTPSAHLFGLADASTSSSGVPAGSSFPGSPASSDIYFRTDLGLMFYYDGTRWLSLTLFDIYIGPISGVTVTGVQTYRIPTRTKSTFSIWAEAFICTTFVATTNDGSNNWTVALEKLDTSNSATSVVTQSTSADTAATWTNHEVAIGVALSPATNPTLRVNVTTKTGAPGSLTAAMGLTYRLIGT